jgi:sugar phosphate isomerase/epimerase
MRSITLVLNFFLLAGCPAVSPHNIHAQDSVTAKPAAANFQPDFYAFQNGLGFGTAEQEAAFLKQHGYAGVGQVFDKGSKLADRVAAYDKANMRVASVYLNVNDTPILEETVKPLANRDAIIELTVSRMSPNTVEAVRQTAAMAARLKIRVALYPHHGNAIATMPQAIELVKKVGHPNLGIMFNLCHFLKNEKAETLERVLKQASPHLFAVSTSGANEDGENWSDLIQTLDKGTFTQSELFTILKTIGYSGDVALQCYAVPGDKKKNLQTSIAAWHRILTEVNSK